MRLFIGIGLPPSLSEALAQAARTLIAPEAQSHIRINWTRPENLHVTISFLGQVEPSRLSNIEQALATIRTTRLHLQLNGAGTFPNAGILFAQVKPSTSLLNLAEQVFQSMEACGFPREQRPYTPHITLARGKGRIDILSHKQDNPTFQQLFPAHELRLYESFTKPTGAHYEVRSAFPLL
ncbi:MAG TPA: RNA 2',3'-cyclic phosphodiesterase [Edaphobacter sp.]